MSSANSIDHLKAEIMASIVASQLPDGATSVAGKNGLTDFQKTLIAGAAKIADEILYHCK